MLADLKFAEKHINPDGDGPNTINISVVQALMSRFCLFEGTWRKYHALGDESEFLDECIRVSELLAEKFPDVHPNYDALNNSADLSAYRGIILYKKYISNVLMHRAGFHCRTSSSQWEMPKYTVESYLCLNGKPIYNAASGYAGDRNMFDEFRGRDYRLLMTVTPPYSMKSEVRGGMNPPSFEEKKPVKYNSKGFYTGVANTMEYAELLERILPAEGSKRLPAFNWSGTMNWNSPNINGPGEAPLASRSGYYIWKFYNLWDENHNTISMNASDRPIFFIEEVLLNLAEAKFEKGQFDQEAADHTINKLRPRAGVTNMTVAEIDASFDPRRDPSVDPVLWEIRRERMVELMGEGFGFQDIRRWKKGPWYINRPQMGVYIKVSDYVTLDGSGNPTATTPNAWKNLVLVDADFNDVTATGEGYLKRFANPADAGKGWKDAYYLFPIPIKQQILNPNLGNNPGWE